LQLLKQQQIHTKRNKKEKERKRGVQYTYKEFIYYSKTTTTIKNKYHNNKKEKER